MRMKINVPYYAQTAEFTCGPACVLMVMKHFDPMLDIGRALEFEVWRQCNMIGVGGADPYGLSVPLLDAGYSVRLMTQRMTGLVDLESWKRHLSRLCSREEIELTLFGMKQNRKRALARGLLVEHSRPLVANIVDAIGEGFVPIALVHMGVIHSLNIPHWVVVTAANDKKVLFNDPYRPKGQKGLSLSHNKFQEILDDVGKRIGLSPSTLMVQRA